MDIKIGIVGLPNVGKSTLFNALTRKTVDISNYPFCTIEPNVGIVQVPDNRLEKLNLFSNSKKKIPAVIEFVDIAGLVKGAAEGEGLGNKFLSHIKEVSAIAEVVRVFEDENITHVSDKPDPVSDMETVEYELVLKDLETVSRRLETARAETRGQKKGAKEEGEMLEKMKSVLDKRELLNELKQDGNLSEKEKELSQKILRELQPLTAKPFLYIFNVSEKQIAKSWQPDEKLKNKIRKSSYAATSAKIEAELNALEGEERMEFMRELGLKESGLTRLTKLAYQTLGLMTFFTTGEDETRAWTVPLGSSAARAGRAIHSDFEEKFIRADVIPCDKLLEAGSWSRARELGWLKTVGKDYIARDGDVMEFKI